jgi:phospholipid/cholesterol/gamma-HCH transport system ATP-binding protein
MSDSVAELEVEVRDLRLTLRPQTELPGFDFTVARGEVAVVLGDNGSGKSLLLAHLAGLLRAQARLLRIHGCDLLAPRGLREARKHFGVVFQQPALLRSLTVFENVALPFAASYEGVSEQVADLLALTGCAGLETAYPHELSEGVKRCVAISRALAAEKRVLLCDEPVAALSPDKRRRIEDLIVALVQRGVLDAAVIFTQSIPTALRLGRHFILLERDEAGVRRVLDTTSRKDLLDNPAFRRFLRIPRMVDGLDNITPLREETE